MSGCGCKNGKGTSDILDNSESSKKVSIGQYIMKGIAFLLMVVLLPIINLIIIWFLFKTIILNKEVNIKPLLTSIGKNFEKKEYEEEDSDYENLTEDDVVMVDVEEIKKQ